VVTAEQFSQSLLIASCLLQVAWLVRLIRMRLVGQYPVLTSYLAFVTLLWVILFGIRSLLPPWDPNSSDVGRYYQMYGWVWVVAQPLLWTFSFCLVVEM